MPDPSPDRDSPLARFNEVEKQAQIGLAKLHEEREHVDPDVIQLAERIVQDAGDLVGLLAELQRVDEEAFEGNGGEE